MNKIVNDNILKELIKCECLHIKPKHDMSTADIEKMFHSDFFEIGASGQRHSRQECIETVASRVKKLNDDTWKTKDFEYREIAEHCYLLTYILIQEKRITRRATIWKLEKDEWKIFYHQGTIVSE